MAENVAEAFNEIVGELDYPMLVVTATDGERIAGCLVGFASQVSIDPPRFTVFLSDKNRTYEVAREADELVVHFLSADDDDLAKLFGGQTGHEIDKFERVEWEPTPSGAPLLERCPNRFIGRILDRSLVGDHVAFLLEPIDATHGEDFDLFPFHRAKRIEAGHEA